MIKREPVVFVVYVGSLACACHPSNHMHIEGKTQKQVLLKKSYQNKASANDDKLKETFHRKRLSKACCFRANTSEIDLVTDEQEQASLEQTSYENMSILMHRTSTSDERVWSSARLIEQHKSSCPNVRMKAKPSAVDTEPYCLHDFDSLQRTNRICCLAICVVLPILILCRRRRRSLIVPQFITSRSQQIMSLVDQGSNPYQATSLIEERIHGQQLIEFPHLPEIDERVKVDLLLNSLSSFSLRLIEHSPLISHTKICIDESFGHDHKDKETIDGFNDFQCPICLLDHNSQRCRASHLNLDIGGDSDCTCSYLTALTPCNHRFHISCLSTWLYCHTYCPYCRQELLSPPALMDEYETWDYSDQE